MTIETSTSLPPEEVIRRAKDFFAARVPATGAFLERESSRHIVLRGQGNEELVIAALAQGGGALVRGSSLLFGQQIGRFFTTLPAAGGGEAS
jgi:hypothetical protein